VLADGSIVQEHTAKGLDGLAPAGTHRFKTLGRRYGLMPDIVNAITGHHRKTVADTYGEFPIEALYREIAKIPAVRLS
jgi:hypothetical protein